MDVSWKKGSHIAQLIYGVVQFLVNSTHYTLLEQYTVYYIVYNIVYYIVYYTVQYTVYTTMQVTLLPHPLFNWSQVSCCLFASACCELLIPLHYTHSLLVHYLSVTKSRLTQQMPLRVLTTCSVKSGKVTEGGQVMMHNQTTLHLPCVTIHCHVLSYTPFIHIQCVYSIHVCYEGHAHVSSVVLFTLCWDFQGFCKNSPKDHLTRIQTSSQTSI